MADEKNKIDITPENMLDHPDTPSDMLEGFATPKLEDISANADELASVAKHPNATPTLLQNIYNAAFPKDESAHPGTESPDHYEVIQNIMEHKNVPATVAEDLINRTHASSKRNTSSTNGFDAAAKHSGISHDLMQNLVQTYLDNNEHPEGQAGNYREMNLKPEFYMSMIKDRAIPQPVNRSMTEAQKAVNRRIQKIDDIALPGLARTHRHNAQSLNETVNMLTSDRQLPGLNPDTVHSALHDLIDKQHGLTEDHLERLWQVKDSDGNPNHSVREAIMNHRNVSPALVAKAALMPGRDWDERNIKEAALRSPKLPVQTRNQFIENSDPQKDASMVREYLQNPTAQPSEVSRLYKKGFTDETISSQALPKELVMDFVDNHSTKAESARSVLQRKDLPTEALQKLIMHKNQDVALEALNHPNADMSVVNAGLKRKAIKVQEAAARHPLVAKTIMRERFKQGKLSAYDLLHNKANRAAYGDLSEEDIKKIHDDHGFGNLNELHEKDDDNEFWAVKDWLASSKDVPADLQAKNRRDFVNYYLHKEPSEPNETGTIKSKLKSAMLTLASRHADPAARNALLQRPHHLIDMDFSKEGLDEGYIREAYRAIKNANSGSNVIPSIPSYAGMARNPSTPEDVFADIAQNPGFLESAHNYMLDRHYSSRDKESPFATVFDQRYGTLDENAKREKFTQIAQAGDKAHKSIVESKTAPKDIWANSWEKLQPNERERFIEDRDISDYADNQTRIKALLGEYKNPKGYYEKNKAQRSMLSSLDPKNKAHQAELDHFLEAYGDQIGQSDNITSSNVITDLDAGHFVGDRGKSLISHMFKTNGLLGARAAAKSAENVADLNDEDYNSSNYKQKEEIVRKLKTDAYVKAMSHGTDTDPVARDHEMKHRWLDAMRDDDTRLSHFIGSSHDANGNLDFLMDLPEGSDMAQSIKTLAVKRGLISHARIAKEAATNHNYLDSYLEGADGPVRSRFIRNLIDSGQINAKNFGQIRPYLDNQTFSGKYTRDEYSDGDYQKARDYTTKLVNSLATDQLHAPRQIAMALQIITGSNSKARGAMTKPFKRELIKDMVAHIRDNPTMDPSQKSQTLYHVWHMLDQNENEAMPANLGKEIVKAAQASGDVPTLMSILESGRDIGTGINDLVKMVDTPETLDNKALGALVGVASSDKVSANSVKKILHAVTARAIQQPDQAHELVSRASDAMMQSLLRLRDNYTDSAEKVKKAKHGADFIARAAAAGNSSAISSASHLVQHGNLTNDIRADLYKSMPDVMPADVSKEATDMILNHGVANSPDIIRNSLSGWKLKTIGRSGMYLDPDNASIVTERIMTSPDLSPGEKLEYAAKLTSNRNAKSEDVVRMARSLGPNGPFDVAKSFGTGRDSLGNIRDLSESKMDALFPAMTNDLHLAANMTDEKAYTPEHMQDLHYKFDNASRVIGLMARAEDLQKRGGQPVSERQQETARAMRNLIDSFKTAHVEASKRLAQGSYPRSTAQAQALIASRIVDNFGSAELNKEMTADMLDMVSYPKQIDELYRKGSDLNTGIDTYPDHARLTRIVKNGEFDEDSFKKAMEKIPEIPFTLAHRDSIEPYMMHSLPVEDMIKAAPDTAASYIGRMFNKMDKKNGAAAAAHVLKRAQDDLESNRDEDKARSYHLMVLSGIENYPELFGNAAIRNLKQVFNDSHKYGDIVDSAIRHGAGGQELVADAVKAQYHAFQSDQPVNKALLQTAVQSPNMTPETQDQLLKMIDKQSEGTGGLSDIGYEMGANKTLTKEAVSGLINLFSKHVKHPTIRTNKDFVSDLLEQPNISREDFHDLYKKTSENMFKSPNQHPALWNPTFGGELLRNDPHFNTVPETVPNVETDKMAKSADASKGRERLNKVLAVLPPQGMQWIDFKRANKSMENLPEVKNLFMAAKGNFVRPEDVVDAMRKAHDPFHITFSSWGDRKHGYSDGVQRHMGDKDSAPNLVMQANLSQKMEQALASDPKRWAFFKKIAGYDGHPNTPRIAAWARIDTQSGKKGWIIEELQSDFGPALDRQIKDIFKGSDDDRTYEVGGHKLKKDEALRYSKEIADIMKNWHESLMSAIEESARNHGVESVYLHGVGPRGKLSGFDKDEEVPVRFKEMYDTWPQKNGWSQVHYGEYPNQNDEFHNDMLEDAISTQSWRKKLT